MYTIKQTEKKSMRTVVDIDLSEYLKINLDLYDWIRVLM